MSEENQEAQQTVVEETQLENAEAQQTTVEETE